MLNTSAASRTSRANLLLSASILALALGTTGRPVAAEVDPCVSNGHDPLEVTCSGTVDGQRYLDNFAGDISVTVDPTADVTMSNFTALIIRGKNISVDVQEGATFASGIRVEQPQTSSPTGTSDIDIIFDGAITQTGTVTGISGIDVLAKYGDTRVTTGSGDITINSQSGFASAIKVNATATNAGDVVIETGSGAISANKYGIDASATNGEVTITTGAGAISTNKYGIRAYSTNGNVTITSGPGAISAGNIGVRAITTDGDIAITTGAGGIEADKYGVKANSYNGTVTIATGDGNISANGRFGINALSNGGAVNITTGAGSVMGSNTDILAVSGSAAITITTGDGVVGSASGGTMGRDEGIRAISGGKSGSYGSGDVTINVGKGGVRAAYGVLAYGANTDITVNGDIITNVNENWAYSVGIASSARGTALPEISRRAYYGNDGMNRITVNAGATVDASNGRDAIRTKYGSSEIIVAGTVFGGRNAAIVTNFFAGPEQSPGDTRVELRGGYDIRGAVVAGGDADQDVIALGGDDLVAFDLSKISNVPFATSAEVPFRIGSALAAPQFYGFEVFEKVGSGTAVLTGDNAEVDNFAIKDGVLRLSDVTADTMAVDLIGGQLSGDGVIGSLIARSSTTVAPGSDADPALIATQGAVTFEAGSTFAVNLRDDGQSDQIAAGGEAQIDTGAALQVTAQVGDYSAPDLDWTVLTAQGGVTGTFGSITDTLIDVDFEDIYDAGAVRLVATVAETPETPVTPGPTAPPVTPVAPPNGGVSDKANGPAGAAGSGSSSLNFASNLTYVAPQDDQDDETVGTRTADNGRNAFVSSKGDPSVISMMGELDSSAFFGIYTERTDYAAAVDASAFNSETTGLAGGVSFADTQGDAMSYQINVGVGISATYTGTAQGTADATNYDLGIGGRLDNGPFRLSGALGLTRSDIDLSRQVGAATATAQTDARGLSGLVEASYDMAARAGLPAGTTIAPLARLQGYSVTADAYSETGAGAVNLDVAETTADALYGGIGLRYAGRHDAGGMTLRPSLSVVYDTLLSGGDATSIATIAGVAGAFETTVNSGPENRLSIDGGVAFDLQSNVEGFVTYGTTFGEDFDSQRGAVGLTIKF